MKTTEEQMDRLIERIEHDITALDDTAKFVVGTQVFDTREEAGEHAETSDEILLALPRETISLMFESTTVLLDVIDARSASIHDLERITQTLADGINAILDLPVWDGSGNEQLEKILVTMETVINETSVASAQVTDREGITGATVIIGTNDDGTIDVFSNGDITPFSEGGDTTDA